MFRQKKLAVFILYILIATSLGLLTPSRHKCTRLLQLPCTAHNDFDTERENQVREEVDALRIGQMKTILVSEGVHLKSDVRKKELAELLVQLELQHRRSSSVHSTPLLKVSNGIADHYAIDIELQRGHQVRCLLDTAAGLNVIEEDVMDRLGILYLQLIITCSLFSNSLIIE